MTQHLVGTRDIWFIGHRKLCVSAKHGEIREIITSLFILSCEISQNIEQI